MSSEHAFHIWSDRSGTGRNRYVLFRKTVWLLGARSGHLNIFADTRYRLMVNGHVVGHGPGRFHRSCPQYDTHDLTPYLRGGCNVLAVMVNSYGCESFHSESSVGCLIAWGQIEQKAGRIVRLRTDRTWRALECPGHRNETARLSYALAPGEVLDARAVPAGWELPGFDDREWPAATLCRRQEHWGPLEPRSIPLLEERKTVSRQRLGIWAARSDPGEEVYSLLVTASGGRGVHTNARVMVMTYIHSPADQELILGAWRGHYWLNGHELRGKLRTDVDQRLDYALRLQAGWNTLLVYDRLSSDWWDFHLALPRSGNLTLASERRLDSPHAFLVGGPWEDELAERADHLPLPIAAPDDLPEELGGWRLMRRDSRAETPCRQRAWKRFEKLAGPAGTELRISALAAAVAGDSLVLLYDFGKTIPGRPLIDFSAASGTVVGLTCSERLKSDGSALVHGRELLDMAERYIAREGRQVWRAFHPRACRYLELLIQGDLGQFALHEVAMSRAAYPVRPVGSFECSDPLLNEIWSTGQRTVRACMEDVYVDDPHQSRSLCAGDLLVEFLVNLACFGDRALMRRCLQLLLEAQAEDGSVPPGAHGLARGDDAWASATLPQLLWQYYAHSGDMEFLNQSRKALKRLMRFLESLLGQEAVLMTRLSNEPGTGASELARPGSQCALNCMLFRAFSDAARIMERIGLPDAAEAYRLRAGGLGEAIRREFWDEDRGAFVDCRKEDDPRSRPSAVGNALAVWSAVADAHQAERAVAWLADVMQANGKPEELAGEPARSLTPPLAFYALGALYRRGQAAVAEGFIRRRWSGLLKEGRQTWPEFLREDATASQCHGASSCPTYYLSSQVLGVGLAEAGDLKRVRIRPQPGSLAWAEGTFPHPQGPIWVRWEWRGGRMLLHWEGPPGVEVEAIPAPPHVEYPQPPTDQQG